MTVKILAVDDERLALGRLTRMIKIARPESEILSFTDPEEALAVVRGGGFFPDVAFLDIEMFGVNGIEIAKRMREICPHTKIIFVTGHERYAYDAYTVHARGYILKPATDEQIKIELDEILSSSYFGINASSASRLTAQTFGSFEFFVDGKPVLFPRAKSKELLAFLVDRRGAGVTIATVASVLWENKQYDRALLSQIQKVISDMLKALKDADAGEIIVKKRNFLAVDTGKFDCDLYRFLNGEMSAINTFTGEYMTNYSWSEFTTGALQKQ